MLTMIGKRLMFAIPSLIGVVIVTFLLTRALPGDPAAYFAGPAATKEAVEQIRKKLGLDKPLIEQFFRYTNDLAHGDFGNSLTTGQPVAAEIRNRLPASAELTLLGLVVSVMIAIPLGVLAATVGAALLFLGAGLCLRVALTLLVDTRSLFCGLGFHAILFDGSFMERQHSARHVTDLIVASGVRDLEVLAAHFL